MVTCRPDISYALIKLSQNITNPAEIHYKAANKLINYLAATKDGRIYYWRNQPYNALPIHPHQLPRDNNEIIPLEAHPTHATTFIDADWGDDRKHRRSTSGYTILIAGGAVLYKTKFQPTIALSTTEAEISAACDAGRCYLYIFSAACDAGRCYLFIRSLLEHIQVPQEATTTIYEDNNGAVLMANAGKPTRRSRHIELKYFAIKYLVKKVLIMIKWISSTNNCSDSLSKPLARTLQYNTWII